MDKLGLREEGLAERFLQIRGVWEDHARYAMTIEEWDERRDEIVGKFLLTLGRARFARRSARSWRPRGRGTRPLVGRWQLLSLPEQPWPKLQTWRSSSVRDRGVEAPAASGAWRSVALTRRRARGAPRRRARPGATASSSSAPSATQRHASPISAARSPSTRSPNEDHRRRRLGADGARSSSQVWPPPGWMPDADEPGVEAGRWRRRCARRRRARG